MTLKSKLLCIIISFSLLVMYLAINPLIIDTTTEFENPSVTNLKKGDTIKVLNSINLTDGNYKAILLVREQVNLSKYISKGKILVSEDRNVLKQIQDKWIFLYNEVDQVTVENEFLLYKNNILIFRCGIVLDKNIQGLQDIKFGWITSIEDVSICFKDFHRLYTPIVLL